MHHDQAAHDRARRRYDGLYAKADSTGFPEEAAACRAKAEQLRAKYGLSQERPCPTRSRLTSPRRMLRPACSGWCHGKDPKVFADRFTNIIDIAFDKRGRMYVLEIAPQWAAVGRPSPPPRGPVGTVREGRPPHHPGQRGLAAPGGFVLGHGAAYINKSTLPDAGEVVKVAI